MNVLATVLPTLNDLAATAVNATALGVGSAVGTYLANKAFLHNLDKLAEKINKKLNT